MTGSEDADAQRLQFFLSKSTWNDVKVNNRRLQLIAPIRPQPPYDQRVLVIDDSGDRKDGTTTARLRG